MLAFISDQESSDTSFPIIGIDPLTDGQPVGAFPFLFDLLKDYSVSHADAAYLNGEVIEDIAGNADGAMRVAAGHAVTSGAAYGGADFSALSTGGGGTDVEGPAGSLAGIQAAQYFAVAIYAVLPSKADWCAVSTIAPFFQSAAATYTAGADMVTICQVTASSTKTLRARRQTNGGSTFADLSLVPDDNAFGKPALILYWRDASGPHLRLITKDTDQVANGAVAANNTGDFSATTPKFGITPGFWNFAGQPTHAAAAKFTLLRGWVANLSLLEGNLQELAVTDFARIAARLESIG